MSWIELFLIALGLSMDAFAVAVCTGLSRPKPGWKAPIVVGLYFGVFQAAMPLLGYLAGVRFADKIVAFDHWIAFFLLALIGARMIKGSFEKACPVDAGTLGVRRMLPLAVATSIDALAVGVSFAFLSVSIVPAVCFIGAVTFLLSALGVVAGSVFGARFKSKAELAGGVILILIGLKILLEHLEIINF